MLPSRVFAVLLAVFALTACGSEGDEEASFDYGRDEMKQAIEGTWNGTAKAVGSGAPDEQMTLKLTYTAPDLSAQCNNRVLSSEDARRGIAPRCAAVSSMNLTGTLTSVSEAGGSAREMVVRGTFAVMSLRFDGHGEIEAEIDDGRLSATLSDDVLGGSVFAPDGAQLRTFSLRREK